MASNEFPPFDIAIIGLSCRFPGAENPEAFWDLLEKGGDAITQIPPDRFDVDAFYNPDPEKPGTITTRHGGFLSQVDQFDPAFFGIPPRAANAIDPQQRLALEVSWEALENAAIAPGSLKNCEVGVFVGVCENDYARNAFQAPTQIDLYSGTGNLQAFVAGRIAYVLGVQGQAQSVNTACSSSLVAVHTACQALRLGECELALAGGVQVILSPHNYIFLSRAKALSPDGRSKAFDAAADGFSRGEGCGMVVLKRLADARQDRDKVLGVIRASVVNNDGPSGGLTVPNVAAQERLLRTALQRADLTPDQVGYLEAHGTGTILGDPLEMMAAGRVYGPDRDPDRPLTIGSVKSNIGHSEAAAGIAGLIKVILAMGHGRIPGQPHFKTPNPRIPWDKLPFRVSPDTTDWPATPRIAGVSSFGMSGTNAHLLVEAGEAPVATGDDVVQRPVHILPISGKTGPAVADLTARYGQWLDRHPDLPLADICFTAANGRDHFTHRTAVVAETLEQLSKGLSQPPRTQPGQAPVVVMLFTGQGSQYSGMGQGLYDTQPIFRKVLDRCAAILVPLLDTPLTSLLFDPAHGEQLNQTRYTQPALFSLEVALYEWWRSLGIEPDVVMGHSLGEYVAAYAAGVFSLEDALHLVTRRGQLMGGLPPDGAMAAIFAQPAEVDEAIAGTGLSIAAYNGGHQVISGPEADVNAVTDKFKQAGVRIQSLQTSQAFHSDLLTPILDEFAEFAATLNFHPPQRTLISNLTGKAFTPGDLPDSDYWRRHSRKPVQFAKSCSAVAKLGGNILLEIGPHPVLAAMALHCWPEGKAPVAAGSLRRKVDDNRQTAQTLSRLYMAGTDPDWATWDAPWSRRKVELPTYPFQRRRCWVQAAETDDVPPHPENYVRTTPEKPVPATPKKKKKPLIHHLQQALQAILELDDLPDTETNLFDLGLDSLMAVELRKRLHDLMGRETNLSSALILEHPTLAGLAAHLPIEGETSTRSQTSFTPLSAGQQALWFIYRNAPESPAYNTGLLLRFETGLDADRLKHALQRLAARHTMLQSRVAEKDGQPCQWVDPDLEPAYRQWDASNWDEGRLMDEVRQASQQPFVLEKGVFRVDVFLDAQQGPMLLLGLHHIAGDARSMAILGRELCVFYDAQTQGKEADLLALPSSYADFVQWEKVLLAGDKKEKMAAHWQQELAAHISTLQLPTDRPRPRLQTFNGASLRFTLPPELTGRLRALARQEQCTLFTVLFTAFQILLHRHTGQEEILIGVPTSTVRGRREFNDMVGYLVNPMVVRASFPKEAQITFRKNLAMNQHRILTGLDHQPYPFPLLMEQLQPERDPSYPPLVQALFAYETRALIPKRFFSGSVSAHSIALDQMEGQFDVSMTFDDDENALSGTLSYNSDLFFPETAQRMSEHLEILLGGITVSPDREIHTLPMLTQPETLRLIDWNRTTRQFSTGKTIVELFENQVEKTPLAIAVVFGEERLTYRELNERVNRLAHYLAQHLEDLVAQLLPTSMDRHNPLIAIAVAQSADMVIGLLGILKAGGAYLPIDPTYPAERIKYMLTDSAPALLLTQTQLKTHLPIDTTAHKVICLDDEGLRSQPVHNPPANRTLTDLAYVIYTSGSTGKPKGVMIEHAGLVNLVFSQIETFQLLPDSRVLQFASFSFDASVSEITTTLLSGGTLYIASKYILLDPTEFTALMGDEKISHVTLPPSFVSTLPSQTLQGLKTLVVAGEACPAELVGQWADQVRFINAYGPTENTVCATMAVCSPDQEDAPHIGQPIPNVRIHILDTHNQPVPPGIPGELCIAGAGLARGYLNRPGLTAEKFVEIQLFDKTERIYKTGDLARFLPDGNLDYMGRLDHQIKLRGFRIELGEIEAALAQHPIVKEAVVTVYETNGDRRLAAYLTSSSQSPEADPGLKPAQLRERLKQQLPDYMIPNHFMVLDRLPLTPNGKINRKALPDPQAGTAAKNNRPATPTEEILSGLWSRLFSGATINPQDHFFDLGGHSLTATLLTARIRDGFQVELPVRAVFDHPRLADLAKAIEAAMGTVGLPPMRKQPDGTAQSLSFAQQRLWFLNRLEGNNSAVYNMPTALQLSGNLDIEALKQGLKWLVRRHDSLRSTFPDRGEEAVVLIQAPGDQEVLAIHDLTGLAPTKQEEAVRNRVDRHAVQTFDLRRGPLFKVDLLILDREKSVMLLNMHHIISDAWSMGLLIRDLGQACIAFAQGKTPDPAPLAIQYQDYAAWQRSWLQGEMLEKQETYWRQQLAGAPELLELPLDTPRPARQSFRGDRHLHRLSPGLTRRLTELSRKQNVSLFMTLLSTYYILLSRYCRVDDLCVGTPIANRTHSDTHEAIGFFVNTLVLRGRLRPDQSVADLLADTRKTCLDAYAHQDIPFEMLVEQLRPRRSLSHSPLFQVMLGLQNNDPISLDLPGIETTARDVEFPVSKFDLSLNAEERDGALYCEWEYAADLFQAATIQRMAGHFEVLLTAIANNPAQPLKNLPMLTPKETAAWLAWNDTATAFPKESTIVDLFQAQVDKTPGTIAVAFKGRVLTYRELDEKTNQLAHYLADYLFGLTRNVQGPDMPETPLIALSVERSLETVVGVLAILKAGGAYVPIDPDYPTERIRYLLKDCGPPLLLTQSDLKAQFPLEKMPPHCHPVFIDEIDLDGLPKARPDMSIQVTDLAYINYTSGSTGQPKGVAIPHQAVVRLVKNSNFAQLDSTQTFLQYAPVSFDAATLEIWGALLNGAKLVVMPARQKDLASLAKVLRLEEITILWLTSSLFNVMLEEHPDALQVVKQLLTGGETLSVSHIEKAMDLLPGTQLVNGYGPTENTTFTCCYPINHQTYTNSIPIGRPIANTTVYIVDENLQPVPVGVPGELVTGGPGLARGYLNRPELTQEKFIEIEIFGKTQRIYRTGDLARLLPSGDIEFLGRMDLQVKLRGFRIELGEIETVLGQLPSIKEAMVTLREVDGDKRLVAYLTGDRSPQAGSLIDPAQVKEGLKALLPDYMIPSTFMVLEKFPLTPNGKADRNALPLPQAETIAGDKPATPTEEILAGVWATLLWRETVHRYDNFFDLGGHSLSATRLIARIRDNFQVELPVSAVFEHPRLDELANAIDTANETASLPSIRKQPDEPPPQVLSFAQQRLWFLNQLEDSGADVYNMPTALELTGELNVEALERSLYWLVRRHDALRSTFPTRDGQAVVQIHAPGEMKVLTIHDLTLQNPAGLSPKAQDKEIQIHAQRHAGISFDLDQGPLFKADLLRLTAQRSVLLLNMHHIISDGWSMGIFMRDWQQAYTTFAQCNEPDLPPLTIQYGDYAIWQREWLQGEVLQRQVDYWHEQLAGAPELLELPLDTPRPPLQSYQGAHYFSSLPPDLAKTLNGLSRELNVSLFMTLLTGFYILLFRYSRMDDVCVGTPIANRTHSSTDDLIGFFVNTLVLRGRLHPDQSVASLLADTRTTCLDAYSHQDIPFEMLVERLQPTRSLSHSPLFQVMFGLQNNDPISPDLPGLAVTSLPIEYPIAKFDLSLNVEERDGELICWWEYATDLFRPSTIERIAGHFQMLLQAMVNDPTQPVSHLPMFTPKETALVKAWNNTAVDVPTDTTIVDLFEQQAAKNPDRIAVISGENRLTYGQLNEKANQTASHLLSLPELGTGHNPLVAIFMDRSPEMVIGILAILKSGGAYVPVDPDYPGARIRHILDDSGVSLVLTQSALKPRLPLGEPKQDFAVISLDELDLTGQPRQNPAIKIEAADLAYVIYTSGTTGHPKGIMIHHFGLDNFIRSSIDAYALTSHDRVLQFASLSFDTAVEEIHMTLVSGAALILRNQEMIGSTEAFLAACAAHELTVLDLPTAFWHSLLTDMHTIKKLWPQSIRLVVIGGEAISAEHVERWLEHFGAFPVLLNSYGPAETTVAATVFPIRPTQIAGRDAISIGRPISNTRIYIMDPHLQPLPPGIPGELCIGGAGLARGYLNRPELTAEKFIEINILGKKERIYKTGDLARWLPNGNIEFLGRMDHQVKLRGFRIELGEIESVLRRHPTVKDAVVKLVEEGDNKRLAVYITGDGERKLDAPSLAAQLREWLKKRVPDYMIPAHFTLLDSLPLTPNGKVDRKKLPAPERSTTTKRYEAPASPAEEIVAKIWTELLGVERVGRHDNFFALGGHSLLVVQLVNRVQSLFEIRIVVRELFEAPTVAGITRKLIAHEPQKGQVDTIALLQKEIDGMSQEAIRAALDDA